MSGVSEERLEEVRTTADPWVVFSERTRMVTEIRRLRAENKELKKKVALLKSANHDLIEEIDGPVTGYSGLEGSWSA